MKIKMTPVAKRLVELIESDAEKLGTKWLNDTIYSYRIHKSIQRIIRNPFSSVILIKPFILKHWPLDLHFWETDNSQFF